jgi:putative ABC transport system permease protein
VGLILKEGMVLAAIGLGLGLIGAYFVGQAMHKTLYQVGSIDFTAVGAVAFVLFVSGALASWIPARRAASVHPMQALRSE